MRLAELLTRAERLAEREVAEAWPAIRYVEAGVYIRNVVCRCTTCIHRHISFYIDIVCISTI